MLHIINTNDCKYYGEKPTKDNKYYGKIYYQDGSSYQGYFLNGKKHGYGEEKNNDGYHFGFYQDGILHGKALSYIKSKNSYIDGYYQDGQLNGECVFFDNKSNPVNKGMFKNGKSCVATYETIFKTINGVSTIVYEGYIYDDKYNGFGKFYSDNKVFIGNFITGRKDGKFLVCYLDGSMVYTPQTNIEIIIDINKVNKDNFGNYKNTIIFNNDMFDDDHQIVFNENKVIKYIGKFNSELKYEDNFGALYSGKSTYNGKFVDGKFISGTFNFPGGKYKGSFNELFCHGEGIIEFEDVSKFTGNFILNKSELGTYEFKYNNILSTIKCLIIIKDDKVYFDTLPNTEFIIGDNKYIGDFKISKNGNEQIKITFTNGKHYLKDILIYEGEFKNFTYFGSGMKYHSNGCIMATGIFEQGEPYKAEYYDELGVLIYSDDGIDIDYNTIPVNIPNNAYNQLINNIMNIISDVPQHNNTLEVQDDTLSNINNQNNEN